MARYETFVVLLVMFALAGEIQLSLSHDSIEHIITDGFFKRLKSGIPKSCRGKAFYTYDSFINATKEKGFTGFGTTGSLVDRKRELAAFFAHVAHETENLCYVEEIYRGSYCDRSKIWPCKSGNRYFGRGPLQLTWNYNYGAAGKYLGVPLLNQPGLVAQSPEIAFKTSIWFWMVNRKCHSAMTSLKGEGFAGTIRAINGGECKGGLPGAVQDRVNLYRKLCYLLRVNTGPKLYC